MMQQRDRSSVAILVVDDFPPSRKYVRSILEEYCGIAAVEEAQDGVEGLRLLLMRDFDLAIVDIEMPRMDGLTMITEALHYKPKQKLLVLTIHTEAPYLRRSMQIGAAAFVSKGAEAELIADLVLKILET